jgi:hypothetical protein
MEGVVAGKMGKGNWYWILGTTLEIVVSLISYSLIFFERITNRNKAKFQKISETIRIKYVTDVESE